MTKEDFILNVKQKYPEWSKIPDDDLYEIILKKYPVYKGTIFDYDSTPQTTQQIQTPIQQEGFFSKLTSSIKDRYSKIFDTTKNVLSDIKEGRTQISALPQEMFTRVGGKMAGVAGDIVGAVAEPAMTKLGEQEWTQGIKQALEPAMEALGQGINKFQEWKEKSPENTKIAEMIEGVVNLGDLALMGGAGKLATTGAKTTVATTKKAISAVKELPTTGKELLKTEAVKKVADLLSPDIQKSFINTIKKAPKEKIEKIAEVAKRKAEDVVNPSAFSVVSEGIENATKQIQKQLSSLGAEKHKIISKAKIGLVDFSEAPRKAILEINRIQGLPNKLKTDVIKLLKDAKNKIQVDEAIDLINQKIYTGSAQKLLPSGTASAKQLKGVIGKLTRELNETLPKSYQAINDKYATAREALNSLNKALGEKVDGKTFKGSSLVKKYFSPDSDKTRKLFEFIKENTGVNLAEDTVLAKMFAEIYGDPTARMLLEGIPTTKGGIINKAIEAVIKKTGAKDAYEKIIRDKFLKKVLDINKYDTKL